MGLRLSGGGAERHAHVVVITRLIPITSVPGNLALGEFLPTFLPRTTRLKAETNSEPTDKKSKRSWCGPRASWAHVSRGSHVGESESWLPTRASSEGCAWGWTWCLNGLDPPKPPSSCPGGSVLSSSGSPFCSLLGDMGAIPTCLGPRHHGRK